MAVKREHSPSPAALTNIFRSEEIKHETSSFIGAFSPTLSAKTLRSLPEFRTATHRIAAWRTRSKQRSLTPDSKVLYDLAHDDDGEKWAGSRLQHVLNDTGTEGTVVVARWYGGQNIGPIRFTHIETCANQAIWSWKVANDAAKKEHAAKKQRLEEESARRELEDNLRERDLNIFVLRKLLADKKAKLEGAEPVPATPSKGPPDYSKMSMETLKRVDKARDATIAFILKEIDKVDEELKLAEPTNDLTEDDWKDAEEAFAEREARSPEKNSEKK
ncbi:hypothetical protein BU23DRAFT_470953 [Bimuria novae-zelandiae CBS 107.79]|uniref:Impact N-terminal domain-containing protein n=1 Tax=Bimuria novae-zelandiae CBS 107.79 TaxID=1447943 RepID=A0A6A5V1P4_9PLEO|nr:hypothetical protein BU23DRAFT_470953 [Bimuria novae-zelandiae CBS 107.79]